MRVGFLFHKNPLGEPTGIDLVRLRALGGGLARLGADVEIVAPVQREARLENGLRAVPLEALAEPGRYDVLKACYHFSLELLGPYAGPLACRLVRVVDQVLPRRDEAQRGRLLACQDVARERAQGLVLNNPENARRWVEGHGRGQSILLLPTGCPAELPRPRVNPWGDGLPVLLFLGSLAAPRMVGLLNDAARLLKGRMAVHFLGRDKSRDYGGGNLSLSGDIVRHGETPEPAIWDYVRHAQVGLALAAGPDPFDSDLSKVVAYLRGGLPVLCEEGVLNAPLAVGTGLGRVFRHGDPGDCAAKALELLSGPGPGVRQAAMEAMAREHSWEVRAEALHRFLAGIAVQMKDFTPRPDSPALAGGARSPRSWPEGASPRPGGDRPGTGRD